MADYNIHGDETGFTIKVKRKNLFATVLVTDVKINRKQHDYTFYGVDGEISGQLLDSQNVDSSRMLSIDNEGAGMADIGLPEWFITEIEELALKMDNKEKKSE